ncbi:MAG TPA: hypothetical protein VGB17_05155 [Pyrinomonadaceae bacterium]|jgi:chromosome segregation ATPase
MPDENDKPTGDAKPGDGGATKKSTPALEKALNFINNPEFGKNVKGLADIFNDKGLDQAGREKLVTDLQERDKKRQAELEELQKQLKANEQSIGANEELLKKMREADRKLEQESIAIRARMDERQKAINGFKQSAKGHEDKADASQAQADALQAQIDALLKKGQQED